MLTLTEKATIEIRSIIESPETPEGAGMRIATDPAGGGLTLSVATVPAADDQIVAESGARVFLDPQAAELLANKALDASVDASGLSQFRIA